MNLSIQQGSVSGAGGELREALTECWQQREGAKKSSTGKKKLMHRFLSGLGLC